MGVGSFILTESSRINSTDEKWFRIETENERRYRNTRVSYVKRVTVKLLDGKVTIDLQKNRVILVTELISLWLLLCIYNSA